MTTTDDPPAWTEDYDPLRDDSTYCPIHKVWITLGKSCLGCDDEYREAEAAWREAVGWG